VSDEQLRAITVDFTIEFARVFRSSSPDAGFSFLSGNGADPTGRSRLAFARYKGEAENALLAAGFPSVYIFRPAYIYPVEPRKEPNFSYRFMRAIYPTFRLLFPNQVIRADELAEAMVDVVVRGAGERRSLVLENRDIWAMVESFSTSAALIQRDVAGSSSRRALVPRSDRALHIRNAPQTKGTAASKQDCSGLRASANSCTIGGFMGVDAVRYSFEAQLPTHQDHDYRQTANSLRAGTQGRFRGPSGSLLRIEKANE
jgi:uncharacterized protein YbjT (DUF2867 family)